MRLLTVAATLVLPGACFTPEYEECIVSCALSDDCPDGHACRSDGFCHRGPADRPINACITIDAAPGGTGWPCALDQDDCDERSACDIVEGGQQAKCRPAGLGTHLASCKQPEDCAAGFHCSTGFEAALCVPFCQRNDQCASMTCVIPLYNQFGNRIPGATLCSAGCSPVSGAPCPNGMACAILSDFETETFYTECVPSGPVALGGSCDSWGQCAVGTTCYVDSCHKHCLVEENDCPVGQTCGAFGSGTEGHNWGICI